MLHNRLNDQTDVQICSQSAWDNHESAPAYIGNCSPDHNSRCRFSVSMPQTGWLQALTWHPSNQHAASTGTKAEPTFIRKHKSPLRPPMSSSLTTTHVENGSGLESVDCTLQGTWLGAVLEATDL
ncbi:hypothetical protein AVEN_232705-1 [Araneus ventricosus]|uniref:Uncharacterized protein n=1 Tax=Araneus ventricosus TaxID=182803 RepID=A0A4Y2LWZ2_ARAVE|nr:hypothetical protein AVEN_232705-1 [Araneus ventricosus]